MSTKVALIGCVDFSQHMCQTLLEMKDVEISAIVTRSSSAFNSDFCSLESIAKENNIPCHSAIGRDDKNIRDFLEKQHIDLLLCMGWSYLLSTEVREVAVRGCIGYHPAMLPHNRGRHPIIWALALGLNVTASTFFMLDDDADVGPIVDQRDVQITEEDDAATLYEKMIVVSKEQLRDFLPAFLSGQTKLRYQDSIEGNHWRKRSASDGRIDWRMNYAAIQNLVRALVSPYPGATVVSKEIDSVVSKVSKGPLHPSNIEPGKVLEVIGRRILVKCWDGSVWIEEHEIQSLPIVGDYLK